MSTTKESVVLESAVHFGRKSYEFYRWLIHSEVDVDALIQEAFEAPVDEKLGDDAVGVAYERLAELLEEWLDDAGMEWEDDTLHCSYGDLFTSLGVVVPTCDCHPIAEALLRRANKWGTDTEPELRPETDYEKAGNAYVLVNGRRTLTEEAGRRDYEQHCLESEAAAPSAV